MIAPILLALDHAQKRMGRDRLTVLAEGSYKAERGGRVTGWDLRNSTDVWQDPITYTAMLLPGPMDRENWASGTSGIYDKYGIADCTFSAATGWSDTDVPGGAGWMRKAECSDDTIYTPTLSNINQGMWVARYAFAASDTFVLFECGWSDDGSREVALRVWSNGEVDVYKGGALVGDGKISGGQSAASTKEDWVGVMILPFRRRELLVVSNKGDGFSHLFVDLPEDGLVQEITPATKFWVNIPSGTATIQVAKVQFKSSGTLYSTKRFFASAPPATPPSLSTEVIGDAPGYGSVTSTLTLHESDLSGAFTPNGTKKDCRIKIALTGGPSASPFIYAGFAAYEYGVVDSDDSEETEVEWQACSLTVPDSPDGTKFIFGIRDPENAGPDRLTLVGNRPTSITMGTKIIVDGRTGPPKVTRGKNAQLDVLALDVLDSWEALKQYRFQERLPLDGLDWKVALELLFGLACFESTQLDIEDPGLTLGLASSPTAGEWSVLIKEGDTCAQWVERLFEGFAGDWFYGLVPQSTGKPKFIARSPASLSTTADVNLYTTRNAALSQLATEGMSAADRGRYAWQRLVQGLRETRVFPEATDIRVTGLDLRQNKYLQASYVDEAAEDPTIAPSLRQDNWMGTKVRFGYVEPMLTTQELVDDAAAKLGDRITRVRTLVDFESDFIIKPNGVPLWRGEVVQINDDKKYRIRSLQMRVDKDMDDGGGTGLELACRRPTTYTAELIDTGAPWAVSSGQVGSRAMSSQQLARLANQMRENINSIGTSIARSDS